MESQLVIDVRSEEIAMCLLEDRRLVEFQREKQTLSFLVGDIYLGKIKKVMPGLNAAFVDVGSKKDAFLHYHDLGKVFGATQTLLERISANRMIPPLTELPMGVKLSRDGKIEDVLKAGQKILVQVVKEPISTKGPRLSAELSVAGRSMVLVPFSKGVSVSQKISSKEERKRLKELVSPMVPAGFGVVIRTSALGKGAIELDEELVELQKRWNDSLIKVADAPRVPALLYAESNRTLSLLRDSFNASFSAITVNDKAMYEDIHRYISVIAPECVDIVQFYDKDKPIFDHFDITRQLKSLFGKTVTYKGGAYLVIEQTEAMHVIDVNSGNRSRRSSAQEETALDVNLSAAEEIARQMRLRDLGGIIVVDFIDMNDTEHRQQLYEHMRKAMRNDRARHNILPLSKFGLMQITRQRVRQAISEKTEEVCPTCRGKGKMQPSILFSEQIERSVADVVNNHNIKKFTLRVHPYVASYLQRRTLFTSSIFAKWKKTYSKGMKLQEDQSMAFLEYRFFDTDNEELDLTDFN